jgi:hypothetical protein
MLNDSRSNEVRVKLSDSPNDELAFLAGFVNPERAVRGPAACNAPTVIVPFKSYTELTLIPVVVNAANLFQSTAANVILAGTVGGNVDTTQPNTFSTDGAVSIVAMPHFPAFIGTRSGGYPAALGATADWPGMDWRTQPAYPLAQSAATGAWTSGFIFDPSATNVDTAGGLPAYLYQTEVGRSKTFPLNEFDIPVPTYKPANSTQHLIGKHRCVPHRCVGLRMTVTCMDSALTATGMVHGGDNSSYALMGGENHIDIEDNQIAQLDPIMFGQNINAPLLAVNGSGQHRVGNDEIDVLLHKQTYEVSWFPPTGINVLRYRESLSDYIGMFGDEPWGAGAPGVQYSYVFATGLAPAPVPHQRRATMFSNLPMIHTTLTSLTTTTVKVRIGITAVYEFVCKPHTSLSLLRDQAMLMKTYNVDWVWLRKCKKSGLLGQVIRNFEQLNGNAGKSWAMAVDALMKRPYKHGLRPEEDFFSRGAINPVSV